MARIHPLTRVPDDTGHMPTAAPRRLDYLPLDDIEPATRNPKRHAGDAIAASIERFGYVEPIVMDERTGRLVAGHGRLEQLRAARDAGNAAPDGVKVLRSGVWQVPVNRGWSSKDDAEAEAYLAASNRLVELGGWDDGELGRMLADITAVDADLARIAGFQDDDLKRLLDGAQGGASPKSDADDVPALPAKVITQPGDVWLLGSHRLVCGDSRDRDLVKQLLGEHKATLAFTSPPYASQRKYDEASGFTPIPPDDYAAWFEAVQDSVAAILAANGSWLVNIKEHADDGQRSLYVKDLVAAHVRQWSWCFIDEFCWVDTKNGVPGAWRNRFKDAWEPVFHFAKKTSGFVFNPMANATDSDAVFSYSPETAKTKTGSGLLGEKATTERAGRARPSNVVHIAASSSGGHSAAFPVALPEWFIRTFSDVGQIVFDPFLGSGTTLIAAEREHRHQDHTGTLPILEATGEPRDFSVAVDG
jgi:DNA modification methylase